MKREFYVIRNSAGAYLESIVQKNSVFTQELTKSRLYRTTDEVKLRLGESFHKVILELNVVDMHIQDDVVSSEGRCFYVVCKENTYLAGGGKRKAYFADEISEARLYRYPGEAKLKLGESLRRVVVRLHDLNMYLA